MKGEKVNDVINLIKNMDLKNKLRLGVCMSSSIYTKLNYNKAHIHSVFDKKLKEIDNDYKERYAKILEEYDPENVVDTAFQFNGWQF